MGCANHKPRKARFLHAVNHRFRHCATRHARLDHAISDVATDLHGLIAQQHFIGWRSANGRATHVGAVVLVFGQAVERDELIFLNARLALAARARG